MASARGLFGRTGFIFAAVGSAIGLGNIWKFPYITYANQGGSFVLVYLASVVMVGAPLLIAETLMGRHTGSNPIGAFRRLGNGRPGGGAWGAFGALAVVTMLLVGGYYSLVAGWTVFYCLRCLGWSLGGFDLSTAEVARQFDVFLANGPLQIGLQVLFVIITAVVVAAGIRNGIERLNKVVMPALGVVLVVLTVAATRTSGFGEAIRFLFHVGPIGPDGVLEAVGHSFFTLGVGMGILITYGSYMPREQSLPRAGLLICAWDTLVGLLACVVMFSIIFSVPAAERASSFSKSAVILFTTLPHMLFELPLGGVLAPAFYLLTAFAALTSTIAGLEMLVSVCIDELGWTRMRSTLTASACWVALGVPTALSVGAVPALGAWQPLGGLTRGVFDTFDYLVSNWLLPIGGLGVAILLGWVVKTELSRREMEKGHGRARFYLGWRLLVAVVSPVAVLWILWAVIGGRSFS